MALSDFDDDYEDDTPPRSPLIKAKLQNRTPPWRTFYRAVRHFRGLILGLVVLFFAIQFIRTRRAPFFTPKHSPTLRYKNVDWRLYAYSQYATDSHHVCNALMVFDSLERLGSKATKILMYPEDIDLEISDVRDRDSQLLVKAEKEYGVKLVPIAVEGMRIDKGGDPNASESEKLNSEEQWDTSITKFLAFNQTSYLRILHFDSDVTVLKNMDSIFLLPDARIAMTRAYWKLPEHNVLSPQLMLIEPSEVETNRLMDAAEAETRPNRIYDMEILNKHYSGSAMVLPHRVYGLHTGEFRSANHTNYHGNDYEEWHPQRAMAEASLIHFADHPLPKPWIMWPQELLKETLPKCDYMPGTPQESGCRNKEIWMWLYDDFRRRRKEVCGLLSVPAPDLLAPFVDE